MILLDTNVLVGLVDERDGLHHVAARDLKKLSGQALGVTSAVLAETLFLLTEPHHRRRLQYLLEALAVAPLELAPPWWHETFEWVHRYEEHEPDLADAQLVVSCTRDKGHRVWTYDKEFWTTWRRSDGTQVPVVGMRRRSPAR